MNRIYVFFDNYVCMQNKLPIFFLQNALVFDSVCLSFVFSFLILFEQICLSCFIFV